VTGQPSDDEDDVYLDMAYWAELEAAEQRSVWECEVDGLGEHD
jgi:hypothetical protein